MAHSMLSVTTPVVIVVTSISTLFRSNPYSEPGRSSPLMTIIQNVLGVMADSGVPECDSRLKLPRVGRPG